VLTEVQEFIKIQPTAQLIEFVSAELGRGGTDHGDGSASPRRIASATLLL
jgi:hypothetical protein